MTHFAVVYWYSMDRGIVLSRHRDESTAERRVERLSDEKPETADRLGVVREVARLRVGSEVTR